MNISGVSIISTASGMTPTPSPKLEHAAHQFEASMLTELLKPLQERSEFSDKDQDDDDESSAGSMREYGVEAMAQSLSEHGGLGIAKMVLAKLGPVEAAREHSEDGSK